MVLGTGGSWTAWGPETTLRRTSTGRILLRCGATSSRTTSTSSWPTRTPAESTFFIRTRTYVKGDEAFDDIVSEGGDLVVIQCKGASLPIDARYGGKCEPFLASLNKRFGFEVGAACEQLLRNLQFTFGINGERREMRGVDIGSVKTVYPLAIVQEPVVPRMRSTR
jgi:hypothetical protein